MKNVTSSVLEDVATFMGICENQVLEERMIRDSNLEEAYILMRIFSVMRVRGMLKVCM